MKRKTMTALSAALVVLLSTALAPTAQAASAHGNAITMTGKIDAASLVLDVDLPSQGQTISLADGAKGLISGSELPIANHSPLAVNAYLTGYRLTAEGEIQLRTGYFNPETLSNRNKDKRVFVALNTNGTPEAGWQELSQLPSRQRFTKAQDVVYPRPHLLGEVARQNGTLTCRVDVVTNKHADWTAQDQLEVTPVFDFTPIFGSNL